MPAPTFVAEYETVWNTGTSPKVSPAFNALAGDILVCVGATEDQIYSIATPTNTQGALVWTPIQSVTVANYSAVYVWVAEVDANKTGMTVSATRAGGGGWFGINVLHFRGSDGVGASAKTNVASGAPSLNLINSADNSAVITVNADWTALSTARTWRTVGVAATEMTYSATGNYTIYIARYSDAGVAGSKITGLSAPTNQKYSIISVEILGTAGAEPNEGSGSSTFTWTGTAEARADHSSEGSDQFSWSGVAEARVDHVAGGSGMITWDGLAEARADHSASGSDTFSWDGVASALDPGVGSSGSDTFTWVGTAEARRASIGGGSDTFTWEGTAVVSNGETPVITFWLGDDLEIIQVQVYLGTEVDLVIPEFFIGN